MHHLSRQISLIFVRKLNDRSLGNNHETIIKNCDKLQICHAKCQAIFPFDYLILLHKVYLSPKTLLALPQISPKHCTESCLKCWFPCKFVPDFAVLPTTKPSKSVQCCIICTNKLIMTIKNSYIKRICEICGMIQILVFRSRLPNSRKLDFMDGT